MQCNHNWNSSSYLWILTNWFKSLYKEAKDPECCSVIKSWLTLCNPMNYSTSGFPVLHCLPEFAQTNAHCVNDTIQPSHPLSSLSLLARTLSQHQGFSKESALHIRRPKYWSFSFSPSSEYSGLISFRIDWFDLAVQGTLKSLLEHHNSKASILWLSTFFLVQHSHPYTTVGKTHSFVYTDLCRQSDVSAF